MRGRLWILSAVAGVTALALLLTSAPAWGSGGDPASRVTPQPYALAVGPDNLSLSTPQLLRSALSRGDLDLDTYLLFLSYALGDYRRLPEAYRSAVPWHGTPVVRLLEREAPSIKDPTIRAQVMVPHAAGCGQNPGFLQPEIDATSPHFYIQFDPTGIGGSSGLTLADYRASLEANAWERPVNQFGWAAPPVTIDPPTGERYHVIVADLSPGLYGYVTTWGAYAGRADGDGDGVADGDNPHTPWTETTAYASCMVLNEDFSLFPGGARHALDATTAHEFHHALQFGYGALVGVNVDDNFVEGSAVWMEDEVNDASDDNYQYLWPRFDRCMAEYPSGWPGYEEYGFWLTFRSLMERYGTAQAGGSEQVMQNYWEWVSNPATRANGAMLDALDAVLGMPPAATNLADAYHAYAIATRFMRPCGGGYVYPYCFEEGSDYVAYKRGLPAAHGSITEVPGSYAGTLEDNYALNWVLLPGGLISYSVTLQNEADGGVLRGSLVCDDGAQLRILPFPELVAGQGSSTVERFDATGCLSIAAVLTNQEQTGDNPSTCTPRSYRLEVTPPLPAVEPAWESLVYLNGSRADGRPLVVAPNDLVALVERVRLDSAGEATFSLLETWTDPLEMQRPADLSAGNILSDTGWLRWEASDVQGDTWHVVTTTFSMTEGTWGSATLTETLTVTGARSQSLRLLELFPEGTCLPLRNPAFEFAPVGAQFNPALTFTGTMGFGDPPTYTWRFGDGTQEQGNPVSHQFPQAAASQSYSVTMGVENGCSGPLEVSQWVMVHPLRLFLPLLVRGA